VVEIARDSYVVTETHHLGDFHVVFEPALAALASDKCENGGPDRETISRNACRYIS